MSRICKSYSAKLKAKAAIEALQGETSILEICKENNIPKSNLLEWKNKLINEAKQSTYRCTKGTGWLEIYSRRLIRCIKL
jgi:transposase-like protein